MDSIHPVSQILNGLRLNPQAVAERLDNTEWVGLSIDPHSGRMAIEEYEDDCNSISLRYQKSAPHLIVGSYGGAPMTPTAVKAVATFCRVIGDCAETWEEWPSAQPLSFTDYKVPIHGQVDIEKLANQQLITSVDISDCSKFGIIGMPAHIEEGQENGPFHVGDLVVVRRTRGSPSYATVASWIQGTLTVKVGETYRGIDLVKVLTSEKIAHHILAHWPAPQEAAEPMQKRCKVDEGDSL